MDSNLPDSWTKCFSSTYKKDYYSNKITKESVWTLSQVFNFNNANIKGSSNDNKSTNSKVISKMIKPLEQFKPKQEKTSKKSLKRNKSAKNKFKLDEATDKKSFEDSTEMEVDIVENVI